jgi:hypothetical protein
MDKHQSTFPMSHVSSALVKAYQRLSLDHCCVQDTEVCGEQGSNAAFWMRMEIWTFIVTLPRLKMNFRQF